MDAASASRASRFQDPTDRRFVRGLFDWLAPRYDSVVVAYSLGQDLRWKHELVRRMHPIPGERALDLACGTGPISERLASALGEQGVVGLDLNPVMIREAVHRAPQRPVLRGDAQKLPFRDRSFDLVSAGYLFKYVHLEEFVPEVRRVLRPGGRLGGYDFSAPLRATLSGRGYDLYLRHFLPWMGHRMDGGKGPWTQLMQFLASVAPESRWEDRLPAILHRNGFEDVVHEPSLGGAITWVWATVPRAD